MFKRFLFLFAFLIAIVIGGIFWIIHSPSFIERILTNILKKDLKEYVVDEVSIGAQQFVYPGRLIFSNVVLRIHSKDEHYRITADQLQWNDLNKLFHTDAILLFS